MCHHELTVLKFGGSVLRDEADLRTAVHEVYRWLRTGGRVVAVVSAFAGTTDRLIAQARAVDPDPDAVANPLLLATGELTTASLVVLALKRAGVPATVLSPAAGGLKTDGGGVDANPVAVNTAAVERALESNSVVVIPGFVGVDESGQFTLLGRGGSDLTALFLAQKLNADRCRLIKDVDGLYERDPALPGPRPRRFRSISWSDALRLDEGIVQHKALRFAQAAGLSFEVGAFNRAQATRVGAERTIAVPETRPQPPLRVALLGLGTVGVGVYESLTALPEQFEVTAIVVRDRAKALAAGVRTNLIHTDPAAALEQDSDCVTELIGGEQPALTCITAALHAGKSVVTANKALVSRHAQPLRAAAMRSGAVFLHSAAVGGAVPILETAAAIARTRRISRAEGVVNGTCNFILNLVAEGSGFDDALASAQQLGFAEADPSKDLLGQDAAEKLVLIAKAAFNANLEVSEVCRTPLSAAVIGLVSASAAAGSAIRQVSRLERGRDGRLRASVEIVAVPPSSPLHALPGTGNLLHLAIEHAEAITLRGSGAGRWPTTESVMADLLDLSRSPRRPHSCSAVETPERVHAV